MTTKHEWSFNASTGDSVARVNSNTRLVRIGQHAPYLYTAEFWGDYSFRYPIRTGCRTTPTQALDALAAAVKRAEV